MFFLHAFPITPCRLPALFTSEVSFASNSLTPGMGTLIFLFGFVTTASSAQNLLLDQLYS